MNKSLDKSLDMAKKLIRFADNTDDIKEAFSLVFNSPEDRNGKDNAGSITKNKQDDAGGSNEPAPGHDNGAGGGNIQDNGDRRDSGELDDGGADIPGSLRGGNKREDTLAQQAGRGAGENSDSGGIYQNAVTGRKQKVYTAMMKEIETEYMVVEVASLVVSHDYRGEVNPGYPQKLQPRNRGKGTSQTQIQNIANKIVPELMGHSAKASDGAPIAGDDGVVESGNGRTIALKLAYETGKADKYKQWLIDEAASFGADPKKVKKMKQPVLVRVRKTEVDRAQFAREANQADISVMSPAELANVDADRISMDDLSMLNLDEGDNILSASNGDFLKVFLAKLGDNEAAGYLDSKGRATRQLGDRIQSAVFAMAYNDDRLTSLMSEESDPDIKNIIAGLSNAAIKFAKMDKKLADENSLNIAEDIIEGVEIIRAAKAKKMTLDKYLAQPDFDFIKQKSESAKSIARIISAHARSGKKLGEFFAFLSQGVESQLHMIVDGGGIFGEQPLPKSRIIVQAEQSMQQEQQIADYAKREKENRKKAREEEKAGTTFEAAFESATAVKPIIENIPPGVEILRPFILEETGEMIYLEVDARNAVEQTAQELAVYENILRKMEAYPI